MIDFTSNETFLDTVGRERERQAREIARAAAGGRPHPRLRAALASRLARLAIRLDDDAAEAMLGGRLQAAGRHG